jgi:hypothetical protein
MLYLEWSQLSDELRLELNAIAQAVCERNVFSQSCCGRLFSSCVRADTWGDEYWPNYLPVTRTIFLKGS